MLGVFGRRAVATLVIAASSAAMLAVTVASAEAQSRKKKNPRQLTITQRSFLDSGKYPPVGSMQRYVTMDTAHNFPAYLHHRSRYGAETLPGRFGAWSPW